MIYKEQIDKLQWVIENWHLISEDKVMAYIKYRELFTEPFIAWYGLCYNCSLNKMKRDVKRDMFKSFPDFGGSYTYPLSLFEDREAFVDMKNFTETPKRLELAKHCLEYLENL